MKFKKNKLAILIIASLLSFKIYAIPNISSTEPENQTTQQTEKFENLCD